MPRRRPKLFEVRYAAKPHLNKSWKIVGYPSGKRKRIWFPNCAFAGLRSAKCKSQNWAAVDLERMQIVVPGQISKTGEERKIPMRKKG